VTTPSAPDVSVIVAVYNTMPYLTECLSSLVDQTIGADRMQIVAVDDGSTDGSGAELDRFAARHPGLFTVLHQANSGGPAGPFNRGLDAATGRYVFFVGADDHLGPDALRRMVTAADEWESDVLLGKVVGVNSRHIYQDIFAATQPSVDLFDSPLPRSLANTKLFRRSLLTSYDIRYREDMKIGSDLPFTLEACYRARRISVLADYDFYYAVRRFSATNITYLSRHLLRLETVQKIVAFVAGLIEPGKQRDAVMVRRFDHEIARLLEDDLLAADRTVQQAYHDGIGAIVRDHLTDEIAAQLGAETLIRLRVARDGTLDDLLAVIRQDASSGIPPTVVSGDRRYAAYPGHGRLPDACFDVTTSPDWPVKLDATALTWERGVLVISAQRPDPLPSSFAVSAEDVPATVRLESPASVRISLRADDLLAASPVTGQRRVLSAQPGSFDPARAAGAANATGAAGAAALRAPSLRRAVPLMRRRGTRLFVITPVLDTSGRLMISVVPFTADRVRAAIRRRLSRR
jgi:poly(ribitol-phosphate) beta-N-acetylglucosaminyltransferase